MVRLTPVTDFPLGDFGPADEEGRVLPPDATLVGFFFIGVLAFFGGAALPGKVGLGQDRALLKAASDAAIELADPSPNMITSCDLVYGMFPSWCRRNVAS